MEVKKELRQHQLNAILNRTRTDRPLIIVANQIFPTIKENLREHNIAYLEANGNVYIKHEDVLIWIDGNKPLQEAKDKTNRAFTKTGLKTVFHLSSVTKCFEGYEKNFRRLIQHTKINTVQWININKNIPNVHKEEML